MATHEYWQFAFVREEFTGTTKVTSVARACPLIVELSGLPQNSVPNANYPSVQTSGDHLRVYYGFPENPIGYSLTGKVKVLKKRKEFPRAYNDSLAIEVVDVDLLFNGVFLPNRDTYYLALDESFGDNDNEIYYFTVFYEATNSEDETVWIYSPVHSHDRGFRLSSLESSFGQQMFSYFPSGIQMRDKSEGNDTLKKLCLIFGKAFDEIKARLDQFSDKRHLPMDVDASFIPYLDQLLGWPTNYELSESRRRQETLNALTLWRSKGTDEAFKLALQTLTGWEVNLYKGYNYVVTTATADDFLDPNSPPGGWVESTDGVWADQVNSVVFNGTPNLSNPPITFNPGSYENTFRVMYDSDSWVNTFGVLVQLVGELSTGSPLSEELAYAKVVRMLEYLSIYYAKFEVRVPS